MIVTTQDYGQCLINGAKLPSKIIWERVRNNIIYSSNGYLLFDDSVLDKNGSKKIELARWQYSGTKHDTVMGVEIVNYIYYNPELDRC